MTYLLFKFSSLMSIEKYVKPFQFFFMYSLAEIWANVPKKTIPSSNHWSRIQTCRSSCLNNINQNIDILGIVCLSEFCYVPFKWCIVVQFLLFPLTCSSSCQSLASTLLPLNPLEMIFTNCVMKSPILNILLFHCECVLIRS